MSWWQGLLSIGTGVALGVLLWRSGWLTVRRQPRYLEPYHPPQAAPQQEP